MIRRTSIPALIGRPWVAALVVGTALCAFVAFGVMGVGREGGGSSLRGRDTNDFGLIYAATRAWLHGQNPYDQPTFERVALADGVYWADCQFAYSPSSTGVGLLLAGGNLTYVRIAVLLMNVYALASMCWLTLQMLPVAAARERDVRAFVVAGMFANPFTLHVVWMGQTALVVGALVMAGWYFGKIKERWVLGGLLLALATLKPQVVLLPLAWLLAERRWKLLAVAGATTALLAAPALLTSGGVLALAHDWMDALRRYTTAPFSTLGEQHVFGVQSAFAAANVGLPSLGLVALAGAAILYRARARASEAEVLGILGGLGVLFLFVHDYDLAAIGPLFAAAWVAFREPPSRALPLLGGLALLGVPTALLRKVHAPLVVFHWREVIVLGVLCAVFWRVLRTSPAPEGQTSS
jgi:hypothetical protein